MARRINRRSGGAQRCFASFVESEGPIPCAPRLIAGAEFQRAPGLTTQ